MTSGNNFGGTNFFREMIREEVSGADKRRPTENIGLFWCERVREIIDVARTAVVARGATPGGLSYDVTVLSQDALSEVTDDRKIDPAKPPRITIEDVFVPEDIVAFISWQAIKSIDPRWQFRD